MNLKDIVSHFKINEEIKEIVPLGAGLINDTFLVKTLHDKDKDYVLQKINHSIFKDVDLLQNNIKRITEHIRQKLTDRGDKDIQRKTLTLVETLDGGLYYFDGTSYWRVTDFIHNSKTFEQVTPEFAYLTGKAFGEFQYLLSDLPEDALGATIPDFHNMEFRLEQFREAIDANPVGRLSEVQDIVNELLGRADDMCKAEVMHRDGYLPKRITHCDTKVNNMLFDVNNDFLCVIDLDTTMPGYVLSDFGDFMRTAGNTGLEDDEDLTKIGLNMDIFKEFARGYIESAKPFLTQFEIENLPYGAQLLTYMQTVRFLTDYINGDVYYKIKSPKHNYQRTLAQLAHLHSIDARLEEMNLYIKQLLS